MLLKRSRKQQQCCGLARIDTAVCTSRGKVQQKVKYTETGTYLEEGGFIIMPGRNHEAWGVAIVWEAHWDSNGRSSSLGGQVCIPDCKTRAEVYRYGKWKQWAFSAVSPLPGLSSRCRRLLTMLATFVCDYTLTARYVTKHVVTCYKQIYADLQILHNNTPLDRRGHGLWGRTEVWSEGTNCCWVTAVSRVYDSIQIIVVQHLRESLQSQKSGLEPALTPQIARKCPNESPFQASWQK